MNFVLLLHYKVYSIMIYLPLKYDNLFILYIELTTTYYVFNTASNYIHMYKVFYNYLPQL